MRAALLFLLLAASNAAADDALFAVSTIQNPDEGKQVILPGDFRQTGRADLFIVTTNTDGDHTGRLYPQREDGTFEPDPVRVIELDHEAIVVDTGTIDGRDAIVFLSPSGAIQFDPVADTVRRLATGISLYASPTFASLPHIEFFFDITGDGLSDLVIPNFAGFQVHVQIADGQFADGVQMRAPPTMDMSYDNHPWYQPLPFFLADMTADGLNDAVFWDGKQFNIYAMQPGSLTHKI